MADGGIKKMAPPYVVMSDQNFVYFLEQIGVTGYDVEMAMLNT